MARRLIDRGREQHGFTLIEVLVSALIVTLIAGAVAGGLMANVKATGDQHRRTQAQALAEQDQERLKGLSAEQLNNLSQTYTSTQDNYKFTVSSRAWYLNSTTGASCSSGGGAGATYFKTISTVSWTDPTGTARALATDESVITPPAGGSILAQFHDQTTAPLSGVNVSATGPESDAATSDGNGCTIFTGLDSGNYNLTFTDSGYVDPNGNASPLTDTATVASTGIATPSRGNPIEMGLGGGATGNFALALTGTPAWKAPDLSWYGSGGGYSMSDFRKNDPTGSTSVSSLGTLTVAGASGGLFPFASLNPTSYTNNYQLWAGACRAEEPPAGVNAATVTPGSSQSLTVLEPVLYLTTNRTPLDVKFTFNAATGSTCQDVWTPTVSTTAGPSGSYVYGLPYATSQTAGTNSSSSGLTGSITVCADYKSGTKYGMASQTITDDFTTPTPLSLTLPSATSTTKC
ncbi:MAG TPA: prepilin-type N-terminal cleavage/methylation domain-containing protein [Solirubrobacteraceae bacterium]|nr:prepilin-type N-terminal cleavage/methylation domain-containing protein [Solirubrobacteraceae bacterium]